ncbi:hypothetical protein Maq22A_2p42625 (plasmid) [Methylobacterium aquaticum]|uniref:Uncharacterized protein n=1 Tax=Methylobacterium aquaticum TaxID=270351 RepID=A0A0C6FPN6_9HYPH|nr:hypothetical protein Maq22A_2p42625 [Methylobacterium aquaticum]
MPAIRNLDRPGGAATQTIGLGTGAVTSHDLDAGMPLQPVGHGRGLAVGQQVDDLATFQIAQDRAVALTAPPGPIVDAEHPRCAVCLRGSATSHEAQQRVGADRQAEAPRQACAGFTAERETEVVLEVAEAVSAACAGLGNAGEALGEDTARAMWLRVTPSPRLNRDDDAPALPGEIGQGAGVARVKTGRSLSTSWAGGGRRAGMGTDDDPVRLKVDLFDDETGGDVGQQAFGHRLRCAVRS